MHLIYLDDSGEKPYQIFSALAVPADQWTSTFRRIKAWRRALNESDGIQVAKEFHATSFCAGRGKLGLKDVYKQRRCQIFREALSLLANTPGLMLFNCRMRDQKKAYEYLMNRINRTMQARNSHAFIIADEGQEAEYTRIIRKLSVHNPIPSRYGGWYGGPTKNITLDYILDDPVFRDSGRSYFIQMADFCAYALLRREVQIESKNKYGLHTAFDLLEPICVKECNTKDPMGIIGQK